MSKIERKWHQESIKDDKVKEYLNYILAYKTDQLSYYKVNQKKNRRHSTWLLIPAIILFGASLIVPMLPLGTVCEFLTQNAYQWGYVFLFLTTLLLLADRLLGKSNAWIRCILAQQEMEEVTSYFHGEWLKFLPKLETEPIAEEASNDAIILLKKFDTKLKKVVKAETENWKSYFSNQLANFSKKANNVIEGNTQS